MRLEDIIKFGKEQDEYWAKEHNVGLNDRKEVLYSAKLMEEVGELAEAVLTSLRFQRNHKVEKFKKEDLEDEIADVILQSFIIANSVNANIKEALKRKMEKAVERRLPLDNNLEN